ncbi:Transcription factor Adf-1 [Merluccius polli]|uniref:Transcription factor Adf-1 n=1 Tax=Merluccius polli TaxID=89951 RepID=A0AA47MMI1_MERPO|nr:Transcription factor Adf-1 [Merluccius polli]
MEDKLIVAVGNHPILYDQSLYTYRDTNLREMAWREVSLEVGEPVADCVKRWRSLRDRFRRERTRLKEIQRSGAGATQRQPWRYMGVMGFLTPFLQDRGTTSNLHRGPVPDEVVSGEEDGPEAVVAGVAAASQMEAGVPAPAADPAADPAAEAAADPAAAAAPSVARGVGQAPEGRGRKRRGPDMSHFERGLLAVMEPLAVLASQPQPRPQQQPQPQPQWDEDEVFFRALMPAMRRLSIPRRARLHYEIHQLVYRAEMEELGENGV